MTTKETKNAARDSKLQVLGITPDEPRTTSYKRILSKYQHRKNKHIIAEIYGYIFSMTFFAERGRFEKSKGWLADELYVDLNVVKDIIKVLLNDKLITDVTPPQFKSATQTKYYKAEIEAFLAIEIDERVTNKMTDEKKKEMALARSENKKKREESQLKDWEDVPSFEEDIIPEPEPIDEVVEETPTPQDEPIVDEDGYLTPKELGKRLHELKEDLHKSDEKVEVPSLEEMLHNIQEMNDRDELIELWNTSNHNGMNARVKEKKEYYNKIATACLWQMNAIDKAQKQSVTA